MNKSDFVRKGPYPKNLLLDMGLDKNLSSRVINNDQCISNIEFAVSKLTKAQQQVFELYYKQHMSCQQIAEIRGCLEISVGRHCANILKAMIDSKEFITSGLYYALKAKKKKSKKKKTDANTVQIRKAKPKKVRRWVWKPELMDESVKEKIYNKSFVPKIAVSEPVTLEACINEIEPDVSTSSNPEYIYESERVSLSRLEDIISSYPSIKAIYDRNDLSVIREFLKLPIDSLFSYIEKMTSVRLALLCHFIGDTSFRIGDLLAMDDIEIQKKFACIDESHLIEIQNGIVSMIEDYLT